MTHQKTEYYVYIRPAKLVIPVTEKAGKRYMEGSDGPSLQLLTRTITVSDLTDRDGEPFTVPTDVTVRGNNG